MAIAAAERNARDMGYALVIALPTKAAG